MNRDNRQANMQMQFGNRVRDLRLKGGLTQKNLADRLKVSVSYVSKVENEKLHFGDYPSEKFIHKLAEILQADEDELLVLSNRVPNVIRQRVKEKPDEFRRLAALDDIALDRLMSSLGCDISNPQT